MIWTHLIAAAIAAAAAGGAAWTARTWLADRDVADLKAHAAQTHERAMAQAVEDRDSALAETNRRLAAQQEATNEANAAALRARSDADAAAAAAGRLRRHASRLATDAVISAATCNTPPAAVSAPASAPADLLADMLGRMEAHGRSVAAEADRRGIAGAECEARYDALTER